MKMIILIGHPAHVHMFKYFAHEMIERGHDVLFLTTDKEFEIELLKKENFDYVILGKKRRGIIKKIWDTMCRTIKTYKIARKFHPSIFLSHGSLIAAFVSKLMHRPHISFEDTYNMEQVKIYAPFTEVILTSNYPHPLSQHKHNISIPMFNALLYLHPNKYNIPTKDESMDNRYVLVRFVAWNASHDIGHSGIVYEDKVNLIKSVSKYAQVYISSESELPSEFEQYRLRMAPDKIHDILAHASLVFSEGSTMVEEAAMLGTPSIYINNKGTLYTDLLEEKYDLCYTFAENQIAEATGKALSILQRQDAELRSEWQSKRQRMLHDYIDVTTFLVWFVENYPTSQSQTQENQENQAFWAQFK